MLRFLASGGGEIADLTAPAGAGLPRGQSEPAVESGDAELLPSIPPATPAPGWGGGHPSPRRSQALFSRRVPSWRPSRIPPRRRRRRRGRTSRWWCDAGRASLVGSGTPGFAVGLPPARSEERDFFIFNFNF